MSCRVVGVNKDSDPLRIAVDARMIPSGSMHGIARYVYELLNCINQYSESQFQYYVLVNEGSPLLDWGCANHVIPVVVKSKWISLREQWEIPKVLKAIKADLFHSPSFVTLLYCPCPLIMTIHDLNHLMLPQFYTPLHQIYYKVFVKRSIRFSSNILTVSQFSKSEIVKIFNIDADKVKVTYNGVSEKYHRVDDEGYREYIRELYELPERFVFCLANNKPHKNLLQLVRAYCYSRIDMPLVLASPVNREVIKTAEGYGKKHLIYFARFIGEEHLPTVLSLSDLFVYPSTYEGFGLPPLEALACGVPVVVSNSSSLPEVVGDCGVYMNPHDYQDMANALQIGLENKELRESLSSQGLVHSKKFRWELMAEQTIKVYEESLAETQNLEKGVLL